MNLDSKIYIAGHRGLAGSAIARELQRYGYTNIAGCTCSLTLGVNVEKLL